MTRYDVEMARKVDKPNESTEGVIQLLPECEVYTLKLNVREEPWREHSQTEYEGDVYIFANEHKVLSFHFRAREGNYQQDMLTAMVRPTYIEGQSRISFMATSMNLRNRFYSTIIGIDDEQSVYKGRIDLDQEGYILAEDKTLHSVAYCEKLTNGELLRDIRVNIALAAGAALQCCPHKA